MAIRQEGNTYYGLSTDAKPTGAVLNGREFREMDTGKKYLFDEENGEWLEQPEEGGGGGGGSSTLAGLTDVDISNPTDGQTLVFNSTSGKWENGVGGGGIGLVMPNISITKTGEETGTATCDMTRSAIVSAIENGAICVARITGDTLEPGAYRFASDVAVFGATEEDEASVIFTTYDLLGAGDVEWCRIIVLDDSVECNFTHTTSYNP